VTEKQRQSVVQGAVMHLAKPQLPAMPRALLQANSRVETTDWKQPLLELRVKVMLLVQKPVKPQLLEPQD